MNKKIGIVMGAIPDLETMKEAINILKEFEVDFDVNVISAHRSPERAHSYAIEAKKKYEVIIAAAGGAAHLAGVIASLTPIPVIGVPMLTSGLGGLDSLLSMGTNAIGYSCTYDGYWKVRGYQCRNISGSDSKHIRPKIKTKKLFYTKRLADEVAKRIKSRTELGLL